MNASLPLQDGAIGSLPGATRSGDFLLSVDLGSPTPGMEPTHEVAPHAPRSNGWRDRVIGAATTKNNIFAITVNRDAIEIIVPFDLERVASEWKVIGPPRSADQLLYHHIVKERRWSRRLTFLEQRYGR